MNDNLGRAGLNFAAFAIVCVLGTIALLAVFSQFRFASDQSYRAEFSDVSGLESGAFVRIGGAEVGKVKKISVTPDSLAVVEFSLDPTVMLTESTKAVVRWENPIGDRYLALLEGVGSYSPLAPGGTIPVSNTEAALDLDTLLGGFRPLFRALDPAQVNTLAGQLIAAFQGEGATVSSFLAHTAAVTNSLADRDELIGQVVVNLNAVLGSLSEQSDRFGDSIESLSRLVGGLEARRSDISTAVAHTNAAAASIADLLRHAREPFKETVMQTDRVASIVSDDREWFDHYLETLPHSYRVLSRLGIMGDYFTFYLCDVLLKVNGKGGQPVYVKLAEQPSGRCEVK